MFDRVRSKLGHTIAPPRFLLFAATLLIGWTSGVMAFGDHRLAILLGFDLAAVVFLGSCIPLLGHTAARMRRSAQENDANRTALLTITVLVTVIILFAIATLMASKQHSSWEGLSIIVGTLVSTWLFANTVFTLHYAHLYYQPARKGDQGGLQFPNADEPDYWDFLYFSFTLGMTFQTSDVSISDSHMRKVALGHSMAAFLFNMGVIAFTVNALGGL